MKRISTSILFLTLFLSSQAYALGLGDAQVRSYLGEPLSARITLISRSSEELATVTAGLASAADIEMMGLSRTVSVPMHFKVNSESENPHIVVTSRLPLTDPVLQLVVEVSWAGGRMLREYTMFLDPPTFASKAPVPMVVAKSATPTSDPAADLVIMPAPAPQAVTEDYPDPANLDSVATISASAQQDAPARADEQPVVREGSFPVEPETALSPEPLLSESIPAAVQDEAPAPEAEKPAVTVTVPDGPVQDPPMETESENSALAEAELTGEGEIPAELAGQVQETEEAGLPEVASGDFTPAAVPADDGPTDDGPTDVLGDDAVAVEESVEPELDVVTDTGSESAVEQEMEDTTDAPAVAQVDSEVKSEPLQAAEIQPVTEEADAIEPEAVKEIITESTPDLAAEPENESGSSAQSSGETLGPVQSGQTLWGIASRYTSGSSYSINQAMLAIQRLNPDAFGGNNINSLKRGAILRMPTLTEMGRISERQAMVEAIRQEQAYLAMRAGQPYEEVPAIAETSFEPAVVDAEPVTGEEALADAGEARLQLVPPSESSATAGGSGGSGEQPTGAVSSQEVEEVLARTEEELANAQQENAYLNERIRELEAQVASARVGSGIEDDSLAEMEESLREDRLAGQSEKAPAPDAVQDNDPEPWYLRSAWWVGGLLVLLVVAVIWLLRRMSGNDGTPDGGVPETGRETVQSIRTEAEEILETLDETEQPATPEGNVIDLESYVEPENRTEEDDGTDANDKGPHDVALDETHGKPVQESEDDAEEPVKAAHDEEEAVELDSDDPEVKLDLARAYISMGDDEAAREILQEVLEVGSEAQVSEAGEMLDEI